MPIINSPQRTDSAFVKQQGPKNKIKRKTKKKSSSKIKNMKSYIFKIQRKD